MDSFDEAWGDEGGSKTSAFDATWDSVEEPSLTRKLWEDVKSTPGAVWDTAKAVPSGVSNLYNTLFHPIESASNGTAERTARGVGNIASSMGGVMAGAEGGAALGAFAAPFTFGLSVPAGALVGGAIGGALGNYGFNKGNQLVGNDAPTTAEEDLNNARRLAVQNLVTGGALEGLGAIKSGIGAGIGKAADFIGPQTEAGALAKAGNVINKYTDAVALQDVLKATETNPLNSYKTTGELVGSPELGVLEQKLGGTSKAPEYAAQAAERLAARNSLMDEISPGSADAQIPTESTGSNIKQILKSAYDESKANVSELYDRVPLNQRAPISELKNSIAQSADKYFGPGSPEMPAKLNNIINYIDDAKKSDLSIQELQNLRSHVGDIATAARRSGENQTAALASDIHQSLADTISKAPEGATEWKAANAAYREHAKLFKNGPLSKAGDALDSKVFDKILATPEAAQQFANITKTNPEALAPIKDQLISDLSGLSDAGKVKFIEKNRSQLKTLLQDDYVVLDQIASDIKSRTGYQKSANATSGSNTALKLSDVVERALSNKPTAPEGAFQRVVNAFAGGGGAALALTNPILALKAAPVVAGTYLINALKNRSTNLVQDSLYNALTNPEYAIEASKAASLPSAAESLMGKVSNAASAAAELGKAAVLAHSNQATPSKKPSAWDIFTPKNAGETTGLTREQFDNLAEYGPHEFQKKAEMSVIDGMRNRGLTEEQAKDEAYNKLKSENTNSLSNNIFDTPLEVALNTSLKSKGSDMKGTRKEVEAEIDKDPYMSAVYEAESGRNPNAKNPNSSASGGFQFINSTAKSLGLKNPFDLGESFDAFKKLTDENRKVAGDDPMLLYSAHYLGAPLLKKVLDNKPLNDKEQEQVAYLTEHALPRFKRIYDSKINQGEA